MNHKVDPTFNFKLFMDRIDLLQRKNKQNDAEIHYLLPKLENGDYYQRRYIRHKLDSISILIDENLEDIYRYKRVIKKHFRRDWKKWLKGNSA